MKARATSIGSLAMVLFLSGTALSAQAIAPQSIEDQVLGWIKVYDYKGVALLIKVDQRTYSPAQLSVAQLFANWMQASYLPTGALGDVAMKDVDARTAKRAEVVAKNRETYRNRLQETARSRRSNLT
jgi:hypothetical protein